LIVLCYHKVGPQAVEGRRLNIEPGRLAQHIRWLKRRGCAFLTAQELAEPWPAPAVVLTFDDAYVSTLTYGVEVMNQLGVTGTIFAVTDCVGGWSSWDTGNERPLADWDLLREAAGQGHEIGNHTDSHPFLGRMPGYKQAAHIRRAKARLEAEGLRHGSFCFPYGSISEESATAVRAAGYHVGMTLGRRSPRASDDLALLPRVVVAYRHHVPGLAYKLFVKPRIFRVLGWA
jgi:peptidoglycan/xylan/chitin deacetylase (PgdA/CDA1 family)